MADENAKPLPDLSGIMSMLSNNPALMEMASSILSGFPKSSPMSSTELPSEELDTKEAAAEPSFGPPPAFDPELFAKLAPMLSGNNAPKSSPADERRCALLRAIRPYLSPERRDAIDYMLKFSKLGDLLQVMQHKP